MIRTCYLNKRYPNKLLPCSMGFMGNQQSLFSKGITWNDSINFCCVSETNLLKIRNRTLRLHECRPRSTGSLFQWITKKLTTDVSRGNMHCTQMSRSVLTTLFNKCVDHMSCVCQVSGVYITFVIMPRLDLHVCRTSMMCIVITVTNFLFLYSGLSNMWTFAMILSPVDPVRTFFFVYFHTSCQIQVNSYFDLCIWVTEPNNVFTSLSVCFVLNPCPVTLYSSVFPSNYISHNVINDFIYSSRNLALTLSFHNKQLKNISSQNMWNMDGKTKNVYFGISSDINEQKISW